jgi:hypothetical protein
MPHDLMYSFKPLIDKSEVDGEPTLKKFVFDRTPKMSTYLLAFVVGEFDYIEDTDKNGILIRVYAPVGKKEFGRFALDVRFLLDRMLLHRVFIIFRFLSRLLLRLYHSIRTTLTYHIHCQNWI